MRLLCKLCLLVLFVFAPPKALAQNIAKGQVFDSTNEPIIGATVVEKGNTRNATVTDIDGNFNLKLQKSKTIVISYVGMVTQEVQASQNMTVVMKDDAALVDEIVVVGYTSRARKDLTGSVGSISGAKLASVPVASAGEVRLPVCRCRLSTVHLVPTLILRYAVARLSDRATSRSSLSTVSRPTTSTTFPLPTFSLSTS